MSMTLARRLTVSLLALAAPVALAQPISLRDAVQQALSHDPSLDQAEAGVERSKADSQLVADETDGNVELITHRDDRSDRRNVS